MEQNQAPEVVVAEGLEYHHPYRKPDEAHWSSLQQQQSSDTHMLAKTPEKRILGLHRSTFWLPVVLAIVVIAAAVGGGVGGSIAVTNASR